MAHPPELDLDLIRMRAEQDTHASNSDIPRPGSPSTDEVIVRADEVDEAGANRSQRPILRREGSAPPPPPRQPPPPAPPTQDDGQASESLTLAQLRNLVTNLPRLEPRAYAYSYDETRTFPEELEEWFQYTEEDRELWEASKAAFQYEYANFQTERSELKESGWQSLPAQERERFVSNHLEALKIAESKYQQRSALAIAYIAMGAWHDLDARDHRISSEEAAEFEPPNNKHRKSYSQLRSIRAGCELLCRTGAVQTLFDIVQKVCDQYVCRTFCLGDFVA